MQHTCFICWATNVACGCRGKGAYDNFLSQERGGVKLVGELIHVEQL